ncbi:MAG TPA: lipid kinase YegS, partial [Pseudoalteromonas shioyasakiensis]|nr:lipid kinase YegS [Pseudoalteromonas shioyasakiensis]
MDLRLIINGKKAADEQLRDAIGQFRTRQPLAVRVTYEGGDIERFINEAVAEGVKRVVVAGGDGTVNEAVNALMKLEKSQRLELAILPMGTANDFATAANIPHGYLPALKLAAQGQPHAIDTVEVDKRYFVNVASAGFGAKITATTPPALKNLLGGGAYTLAGLVQALSFVPYSGELTLPDGERTSGDIIAAAVCNGRQAGGGQPLAPHAYINDGLVDLVAFTSFAISDVPAVIEELSNYPNSSQQWVKRFQVPWLEWQTQTEMPI